MLMAAMMVKMMRMVVTGRANMMVIPQAAPLNLNIIIYHLMTLMMMTRRRRMVILVIGW